MTLDEYRIAFRTLKVARTDGRGRPHKACMILAVIDLIDTGQLRENRIVFDDQLKDAFSQRFEVYSRGNDKDNPVNPYFHLSSSGFWHLMPNPGKHAELTQRLEDSKAGGAGTIKKLVAFVSLSPDLFLLLQDPNARSILAGELEGTLLTPEEAFAEWCRSVGKSEETINNYVNALAGRFSEWTSHKLGMPIKIMGAGGSEQLNNIREASGNYVLLTELGAKDKDLSNDALKLYQRYLDQSNIETVIAEDIKLLQSRTLDSTVKETLISARRGQGLFRNRVLMQWGGQCAVTGYADKRFLIASHIKPWHAAEDGERLNGFNGLPLIPNLDKAFDLGYISFASSGEILISNELEHPEKLGVGEGSKIMIKPQHQAFLEYHRSECFI
jgi:predicted restriction endonuclease